MKLLISLALLGTLCTLTRGAPNPAEARIRQQIDKEHEEGVDHIKLKMRDVQAAETSNKDRQYFGVQSDTEMRRGGGSRSKGSSRDRDRDRDDDDDSERDRSRSKSRDSDRDRDRDRDQDDEYEKRDRDRDRDTGSRGSSKRRGSSRGEDVDKKSDKLVYDKQHEDVARYASQDDIDVTKDSYRTKDKTSQKKDEIYITRR